MTGLIGMGKSYAVWVKIDKVPALDRNERAEKIGIELGASNFSTKRKLNKFASDRRTAKAIPASSTSIIISLNKLLYKILQLFAFFYNNLL